MKSRTENLLFWEQRIKERVQNGMTIEEWCEKNGMSKHQYYYWNRRVREKRKPDEEMIDLANTTDERLLLYKKMYQDSLNYLFEEVQNTQVEADTNGTDKENTDGSKENDRLLF